MVKGTFPSTELVKLPLLHYYLKKYPLTSYSRVIGILSDEKPLALWEGAGNLWPYFFQETSSSEQLLLEWVKKIILN